MFFDYGLAIPAGSAIAGIEVRLRARADSTSGAPRMCVQLSWNGGATWTAAKATGTLGTALGGFVLGGAADTWGHAWTAAELGNASFRLRVIDVSSSTARDFFLDGVGLRVHTGTAPASDPPPPPPATDTVAVTRAEYDGGKRELRLEATSSSASPTLQVFVTSTGQLIGALSNNGGGRYGRVFSWPSNPQSVTVRSSLGGSATATVAAR